MMISLLSPLSVAVLLFTFPLCQCAVIVTTNTEVNVTDSSSPTTTNTPSTLTNMTTETAAPVISENGTEVGSCPFLPEVTVCFSVALENMVTSLSSLNTLSPEASEAVCRDYNSFLTCAPGYPLDCDPLDTLHIDMVTSVLEFICNNSRLEGVMKMLPCLANGALIDQIKSCAEETQTLARSGNLCGLQDSYNDCVIRATTLHCTPADSQLLQLVLVSVYTETICNQTIEPVMTTPPPPPATSSSPEQATTPPPPPATTTPEPTPPPPPATTTPELPATPQPPPTTTTPEPTTPPPPTTTTPELPTTPPSPPPPTTTTPETPTTPPPPPPPTTTTPETPTTPPTPPPPTTPEPATTTTTSSPSTTTTPEPPTTTTSEITTTTTPQPTTTTSTETTTPTTPSTTPPPPPYQCYECSSGAAYGYQYKECPANGQLNGWALSNFKTCNGPCVAVIQRWPLGNVRRTCSSDFWFGNRPIPANGCVTLNQDIYCFCQGDLCNGLDMVDKVNDFLRRNRIQGQRRGFS